MKDEVLFKEKIESILIDTSLFELFDKFFLKIPFYKNKNIVYYFVTQFSNLNSSFNEIVVNKELYDEKVYLIKNYKKFIDEKRFEKNVPTRVIVDFVLTESIITNCSDIHIDCFENSYLIRFKIKTILVDKFFLSKEQYNCVISCLKVLSKIDCSKVYISHSSSFFKVFKNSVVDFRFSTHPTIHSQRCVLRVLQKKNVISVDDLELEKEVCEIVEKTIQEPCGLVIISGPTNSGKTTFVHSLLQEIARKKLNIMTLEDPVEYKINNVIQTSVNENFNYIDGLKSILRQDPDVVFIGEIRDKETALLAVQASLTGHKVFVTLHSSCLQSAVCRFIDFGVSNYMLSECLLSVFSLRLFRKYENNSYTNLKLLVDSVFIDEEIKNSLFLSKIPKIKNSLKQIGLKNIEQNVTTKEEIERILGFLALK